MHFETSNPKKFEIIPTYVPYLCILSQQVKKKTTENEKII